MKKKSILLFILLGIGIILISYILSNQYIPNWIHKQTNVENVSFDSVSRCKYENEIVYYFKASCCDLPDNLYKKDGSFICSLSGGYTDAGNGMCPQINGLQNCTTVWLKSERRNHQIFLIYKNLRTSIINELIKVQFKLCGVSFLKKIVSCPFWYSVRYRDK
jgi:hypothetical protein